jgi:hypothetical protein
MKNLKINTLVLSMALLMGLTTSAQEFHYGIKAGANFAVQSEIAHYYSNEDIRIGFQGGVFGNMSLAKDFSLQVEANYEQKGGKSEEITSKYDYITVPVLAKYTLGDKDLKFNFNLGPYVGFLVNSELVSDNNTMDVKDDSEEVEFGAIAGIGLSYPVANNNIVFDLRLGLGLSPYNKSDSNPNNKYVGVSLGYEF